MSVLEISGISRRFGSLLANDNISLTLAQGEILALLGENGAGKTTLMNILFGHYAADAGSIRVNGKALPPESTEAALDAGIGMVHQHFTLADNLSVLDNIILGTESLWSLTSRRTAARQKLRELQSSLGLHVNLDAQVSELSIGECQRVEILKALYRDARILILDEPTAVLTPQEVDNLFELLNTMAANGMSIVLISHKLHEVLALSHRIVVLRHGKVVATVATDSVDRDELAELIVGREVVRPVAESKQPGKPVIELINVSVTDSQSGRPALDSINLTVRKHEIVGVAGVSGNGQRELANVLSGLTPVDSGQFRFDGRPMTQADPALLQRLNVARIPEDRHGSGVIGEMTIWENLLLEDLGAAPCWRVGHWLNRGEAGRRAEKLIDTFDIRCSGKESPAALLSGGNMQKVILARNFHQPRDFVLANQPARGLDEGAIAFVHEQLLQMRDTAGILLVSEDLEELLRLADQIVVMHAGRLSAPFPAAELTTRDLGLMMTGGDAASSGTAHAV